MLDVCPLEFETYLHRGIVAGRHIAEPPRLFAGDSTYGESIGLRARPARSHVQSRQLEVPAVAVTAAEMAAPRKAFQGEQEHQFANAARSTQKRRLGLLPTPWTPT